MYACIHAPDAGEQARSFSPWVEMVDPATAVFTLTPRQLAHLPSGFVGRTPGPQPAPRPAQSRRKWP